MGEIGKKRGKIAILVDMKIDIVYMLVVFGSVVVSMTIHEAMHAYSSYWLGDNTAKDEGRLSLNPIKHIDPFLTILLPLALALAGAPIFGGAKPVPFNPRNLLYGEWGVLLVAIAGPLVNLFLAVISYGALVMFDMALNINNGLLNLTLSTMVLVNLGFFIFNMILIPPLDGSRVLYALAPDFVRGFMESMERYGILVVFGIMLLAGSAFDSFISQSIQFFLDLFKVIFGV